jgi:hypothetical protein
MSKYVVMRDKNILLSKIHKINYDVKDFPFKILHFKDTNWVIRGIRFNVQQGDSNKNTIFTWN